MAVFLMAVSLGTGQCITEAGTVGGRLRACLAGMKPWEPSSIGDTNERS